MRTLLRQLIAVVALAACGAQPIALDACRAACDAANLAQIAAAAPCHHAAAGSQIGQPARPCNQAHALVPADASAGRPAPPVSVAWVSTHASQFDGVSPRIAVAESSAGPPSIPGSVGSNTPLRV